MDLFLAKSISAQDCFALLLFKIGVFIMIQNICFKPSIWLTLAAMVDLYDVFFTIFDSARKKRPKKGRRRNGGRRKQSQSSEEGEDDD